MGKLVFYITLLIFIDLAFIVTGQMCVGGDGCSIGSILLDSILNIDQITDINFFKEIIGNVNDLFNSNKGIGSLIAGITVLVGAVALLPSEQRIYVPIAGSFAILVADFVFISSYLISLNNVLGTLVMGPMAIIYVLVVVEWLRGKD